MPRIEFARDEDFDVELHREYRDDGWIGGPYTEVRYFLSCLTRTYFLRTPQTIWRPAAENVIRKQATESTWIIRSRYFHEFAILIFKHLYRLSELGKRHPIRKELRTERVARYAIANSQLSVDDLAELLNTTVRQIGRNSTAMLALREYRRLNPEP